jgi:hypothetical protein
MDLMYRPIDKYRYEIREQGEVQVWYTGMHRLISSTFPRKITAEGFFVSSRSPECLFTSRINGMTVKGRNDLKPWPVMSMDSKAGGLSVAGACPGNTAEKSGHEVCVYKPSRYKSEARVHMSSYFHCCHPLYRCFRL